MPFGRALRRRRRCFVERCISRFPIAVFLIYYLFSSPSRPGACSVVHARDAHDPLSTPSLSLVLGRSGRLALLVRIGQRGPGRLAGVGRRTVQLCRGRAPFPSGPTPPAIGSRPLLLLENVRRAPDRSRRRPRQHRDRGVRSTHTRRPLDEGSIRGRASRSRGGRCRIFQRLYIISSWLPARRIGQVWYVRPRPIIFEEGGRFARVSPPPGAPVAPIVVESGHSSTFGQPWEFFAHSQCGRGRAAIGARGWTWEGRTDGCV